MYAANTKRLTHAGARKIAETAIGKAQQTGVAIFHSLMRAWVKIPAAICGAVVLAATVQAQEPQFPQKGAIEITVLFPAGSSADVTARLLADGMSKQLGATRPITPGCCRSITARSTRWRAFWSSRR